MWYITSYHVSLSNYIIFFLKNEAQRSESFKKFISLGFLGSYSEDESCQMCLASEGLFLSLLHKIYLTELQIPNTSQSIKYQTINELLLKIT